MPLLPSLAKFPCAYLNLDDLATADPDRLGDENKNRWLDPEYAWKKICDYHERAGIAWSYGGYLERRSTLWKGVTYLEERDTFLHLGIDFNVPPGTPIALTRPGIVEHIDNDFPDEYGWGPRVIIRLKNDPLYLIFAHLDEKIVCRPQQELRSNDLIGTVGRAPFNGGWFSHFHAQAMTLRTREYYRPRPSALDGYGKISEQAALARMFPDPLPYLRVW